LLGNRFETLYLPSSIVLVEGKCDHKFIERVLSIRYPQSQTSVISANGDARIKEILNVAKGLFSDIQKSPYRDRIFVVLDSVHGKGLPAEIESMGIPRDNIIIWEKNGIEYYYPENIVDSIYGIGSDICIENDIVSRNGIKYSKNELADKVVAALQANTPMNSVFQKTFLDRVERTLALSQPSPRWLAERFIPFSRTR
jgi:hypothetical protein